MAETFPEQDSLEMAVTENISCGVRRRRWDWIGHVLRKDPTDDCCVIRVNAWGKKEKGADQKGHGSGWWRLSETMQTGAPGRGTPCIFIST